MFDKLDIQPFEHKIKILSFLVEGTLYGPDVLEIDNSTIIEKFKTKAKDLTALSLGSGYVTKTSATHLIAKAFNNIVAVSAVTNYEISQVEAMRAAINVMQEK